jgi:hypothetical protein
MTTLSERFWAKVKKGESCWLWAAWRLPSGYGQIRAGERLLRAHRVAWELTNGPIPDGLCVLHNCPGGDNPACVNPAHLWLGTNAENTHDMVAKGRYARHNAEKTRCPRGHRYAGENLYTETSATGSVYRDCRACRRERQRKYRQKQKTLRQDSSFRTVG